MSEDSVQPGSSQTPRRGAEPAAAPSLPAPAVPELTRYKLTIAYDGTSFHGWQKQVVADGPPLRTVAGVIEMELQKLLAQPITLVGASRTDAGVHAWGQVAHFDAASRIPVERLAMAINGRLPADVQVVKAEQVRPDFHAVHDAVRKQYRYRLHTPFMRPLTERWFVYHCWKPMQVEPMQEAARRLCGTHDFAAFATTGHGRATTVRTIYDCHVEEAGPELHIVVQGSGFLWNMVRIIAGTLVEVGRGRFTPDVIERALASADRRDAGPTAPAQGLWLEWIEHRP